MGRRDGVKHLRLLFWIVLRLALLLVSLWLRLEAPPFVYQQF